MSIGKIVRWHDDKGFGFVKSDDLDKDVFVHISAFPLTHFVQKLVMMSFFKLKIRQKGYR